MEEINKEMDELFAEAELFNEDTDGEEKVNNPYESKRKVNKAKKVQKFDIKDFVPNTDEINCELRLFLHSNSFIAVIPARDMNLLFGMPTAKLREMIGKRSNPGPWHRLRLNARIRRMDQ